MKWLKLLMANCHRNVERCEINRICYLCLTEINWSTHRYRYRRNGYASFKNGYCTINFYRPLWEKNKSLTEMFIVNTEYCNQHGTNVHVHLPNVFLFLWHHHKMWATLAAKVAHIENNGFIRWLNAYLNRQFVKFCDMSYWIHNVWSNTWFLKICHYKLEKFEWTVWFMQRKIVSIFFLQIPVPRRDPDPLCAFRGDKLSWTSLPGPSPSRSPCPSPLCNPQRKPCGSLP